MVVGTEGFGWLAMGTQTRRCVWWWVPRAHVRQCERAAKRTKLAWLLARHSCKLDHTALGSYDNIVELGGYVWQLFQDGPGNVTRREPFNSTPMGVNSISFGSPHVCPMGRTCSA